jgi:hypothetical protein
MKSLLYFIFFYICFCFTVFAQAPDTLWTKVFGGVDDEKGSSVFQTSDGGFVITGYTESFSQGNNDVWLLKTNELGDKLWARAFGDTSAEWGSSVQQTSDGGFIIGGSTNSKGKTRYDWGAYLIKTDLHGNVIWDSIYRESNYADLCREVQPTLDGGYIGTGKWGTNSWGWGPLMLLKVDSLGHEIWRKTYSSGIYNEGYSIKQTNDGGYIVTGSSDDTDLNLWLLKTDALGDTIWTKKYGGAGYDFGLEIQLTKDSGYIIVGSYGSGSGYDYDVWLLKTNSMGDTLWTKTFGGYAHDEGYSVACTSDGGYIICGYTDSYGAGLDDFWIIKTDSSGSMEWDRVLGGTNYDWGVSIMQTSDGGYVADGVTESFGYGGTDLWLIKLGSQPTLVADRQTVPTLYMLNQNYPNPFNPSTTISWQSPVRSWQTIKVFDVLGNEIAALVNQENDAGVHSVQFDASSLPSGIYFYQLRTGKFIQTKQMVLLQ